MFLEILIEIRFNLIFKKIFFSLKLFYFCAFFSLDSQIKNSIINYRTKPCMENSGYKMK